MTYLAILTIVLTALYGLTIILFLTGLMFPQFGEVSEQPTVSVIIAARNEQENIGSILNDLIQQKYPQDRYEMIVANDHSTDDTAARVRKLADQHHNIRLLDKGDNPKNFSPKKFAIQTAVGMARGDIILATDADCRVGRDWIATMASYFKPSVGFVIGFSQFGARGEKQSLIENLQTFDFVTLMGVAAGTTNLGFPMAASGQNLGYRKSAFEKVGGYTRVAHRVSGDDVLLMQLIRKYTDYRIVYATDPPSFAISEPQPTLKSLINQRKRWASNGAYQLKLNPMFFIYLMQVLLFNAALLVGIPAALIVGKYLNVMLLCLFLRVLFECAIALRSAFYFNRTDVLKFFPLWFVSQIPYIVGVGIAGTFGKFNWKERYHGPEVK